MKKTQLKPLFEKKMRNNDFLRGRSKKIELVIRNDSGVISIFKKESNEKRVKISEFNESDFYWENLKKNFVNGILEFIEKKYGKK